MTGDAHIVTSDHIELRLPSTMPLLRTIASQILLALKRAVPDLPQGHLEINRRVKPYSRTSRERQAAPLSVVDYLKTRGLRATSNAPSGCMILSKGICQPTLVRLDAGWYQRTRHDTITCTLSRTPWRLDHLTTMATGIVRAGPSTSTFEIGQFTFIA
jgi:hypothetical protein